MRVAAIVDEHGRQMRNNPGQPVLLLLLGTLTATFARRLSLNRRIGRRIIRCLDERPREKGEKGCLVRLARQPTDDDDENRQVIAIKRRVSTLVDNNSNTKTNTSYFRNADWFIVTSLCALQLPCK